MAKKKNPEEGGGDSPDFVSRVYEQIGRSYGEGAIQGGNVITDERRAVIPLGPSLDLITSGGIKEGSWVGITGNPKSCKSSTALSFAANAQQDKYGTRPVFYAKVEGRLSTALLSGTKGLKTQRPHLNIIQSSKDKILSAQDYLTILDNVIRTVPGAVVIIDSISALCDERESVEGVGTETRGAGAKLFSQFCRMMSNVVPVMGTIVIGITHLISNTSGMGPQLVERGARAWQYQCDYQLRIQQKSPWKVGTRQIGYEIKWVCNASATGPPGMAVTSFIRFGVGIDRLYELIQFGLSSGLIRKSGPWLSLGYLEKHGLDAVQKQGAENLYGVLAENPAWADLLAQEVGALSGSLVEGEDN